MISWDVNEENQQDNVVDTTRLPRQTGSRVLENDREESNVKGMRCGLKRSWRK
jgi:hypothetical protein